jgi:DNA replication and repair protein RecF
VRHGPKDIPAELGSTGEQKALLVGLVLAHARLVAAMSGLKPLVLLDEIAAHFDPRRRLALFEALGDLGSQVWMSGADMALFDDLPEAALRLRVCDGRTEPAP